VRGAAVGGVERACGQARGAGRANPGPGDRQEVAA
jgi:hypothetical protein